MLFDVEYLCTKTSQSASQLINADYLRHAHRRPTKGRRGGSLPDDTLRSSSGKRLSVHISPSITKVGLKRAPQVKLNLACEKKEIGQK